MEQRTLDYMSANLIDVKQYFPADSTILFGYDEMRQTGGCQLCHDSFEDAGHLLAWHVNYATQLVEQNAPQSEVMVWDDMFSPYHNAIYPYYATPTTLAGSWEGLSCGTVILNWDSGAPNSLAHFSNMSLPQVIAGYYDGDAVTSATNNINSASTIPGIYHYLP